MCYHRNVKLVLVTKKNLDLAIQTQNRIFANQNKFDDGTIDFLKGLSSKPDEEWNFIEHYLAQDGDKIVGCSGLYSYHGNPKEAWLNKIFIYDRLKMSFNLIERYRDFLILSKLLLSICQTSQFFGL